MNTNNNLFESQVKAFFNKISGHNSYLEKRFGIEIRTLIVNKMLGRVSNCSILDIGCGDGAISLQYASQENNITFIDLSENMLRIAKENTPVQLREKYSYKNISFLDFQTDHCYDIILIIGVLAHLPSLEGIFEKISDLLSSDGKCIIQYSDSNNILVKFSQFINKLGNQVGHKNYRYLLNKIYSTEVVKLLENNNLQIEHTIQYSLLLPFMGRLPDSLLFKIQKLTLETPWLSRIGSDVVILVSKREKRNILPSR